MGEFYERLLVEGQSVGEAFRGAKEDLRDRHFPIRHWAGWVATGDLSLQVRAVAPDGDQGR